MDIPTYKSCYTQEDLDSISLHDCHVHGIRWSAERFVLSLDLDYIVKWVEANERYLFWVAPAEFRFINVVEAKISLEWTKLLLDCEIQHLHKHEFRSTPSGITEYQWGIELASPHGEMLIWATGFELRLRATPILQATARLARSCD